MSLRRRLASRVTASHTRVMSKRRSLVAAVCMVAVLAGCSDSSPTADTVHPYPTIEGGFVLGSEVPEDFQEALRISVDSTAARDPDAYWEIIVDGCQQHHGTVDDWARYFVSEQGTIDALLRLGGASYSVADMALDLDQTWVRFDDANSAWVQYGTVHAVDGTLLVPTADTEPMRWLNEDGAWKTTFCTFGGTPPVDEDGRLAGDGPSSTTQSP